MLFKFLLILQVILEQSNFAWLDEHNKRLYFHLVTNYSKLVRPCKNNSELVLVAIDLKLSRIVDVDEKNQIMTTDVWITQVWKDYRFAWDPDDFNDIKVFHMPVSEIWLPDLVLYNTANGKYELSTLTKAELHWTGKVIWKIPAILKSSCTIDVEYFPFDIQTCIIKFSSWTYDWNNLHLTHLKAKSGELFIADGIDIKNYTESDEWDIVGFTARLSSEPPDKDDSFADIKFCLTLRRKALFYMVNLIVPCVSMSFLTVPVFLLSSESGEKITLCISILLALTLFFLLLLDIMPPTSLVVPLLGKYLVFTITMVSLSICSTIYILNIHHRTPRLHKAMPKIVRKIFLEILPRFLFFKSFNESIDPLDIELAKDIISLQHPELRKIGSTPIQSPHRPLGGPRIVRNAIITREFGHSSSSLPTSAQNFRQLENYLILVESDEASNRSPSSNRRRKRVLRTQSFSVVKVNRKQPQSAKENERSEIQKLVCQNIFYLNQIDFFIKNEFRTKKIKQEWKLLAYVFDRILFYIFGISFFFGTFYLFVQAPSIDADENICRKY